MSGHNFTAAPRHGLCPRASSHRPAPQTCRHPTPSAFCCPPSSPPPPPRAISMATRALGDTPDIQAWEHPPGDHFAHQMPPSLCVPPGGENPSGATPPLKMADSPGGPPASPGCLAPPRPLTCAHSPWGGRRGAGPPGHRAHHPSQLQMLSSLQVGKPRHSQATCHQRGLSNT